MVDGEDDEDDETARMAAFEPLNPSELASVWLSGDPDAVQHCYDLTGEFFVDWLVALVTLAEGDDQFGNVGAGPIEACLEQDIALARLVESRVPQEQLRAVLQRMWFSDASPEVKPWALRVLESGESSLSRSYPHGLVD
jgi:hypothetical protein